MKMEKRRKIQNRRKRRKTRNKRKKMAVEETTKNRLLDSYSTCVAAAVPYNLRRSVPSNALDTVRTTREIHHHMCVRTYYA